MARSLHQALDILFRPRPRQRQVEWRVSQHTLDQFMDLVLQLDQLLPDDPDREPLLDDIRALPGYPHHTHPDRDVIVPVVTTARSR